MSSPRILKKFRIHHIQGPHHKGTVNQFHDYYLKLVYDPGPPYLKEEGIVAIRFSDAKYISLAYGDPSDPKYKDEVNARIGYYVIKKLKTLLGIPGAYTDFSFHPTQEEIKELRNIDPKRVDIYEWHEIEDQTTLHKMKVFISCGQQTNDEIALGKQIVELINSETNFEGYFAQDQQSLDGVTRNIFQAIYNSASFISVMHRRNQIENDPACYRGSVWVEQEIAIAAFIVQVLGIDLPNRIFIQSGIKREGVRGYILLNATEFEDSTQILDDLRNWLPTLINQGK